MNPWKRREVIGNATLYLGDCLEVIPMLGKVDAVVTSPPYNKKSADRKAHPTDTWSGGNAAISYGVFTDDLPEAEYQEWQIAVLNACIDALKDGGSMFYNHKNRTVEHNTISPYSWLLRSKAKVKQEIVWDRRMIVEVDKVRFYPKTERIWWLTKESKQPFFNEDCAALTDVWEIAPTQGDKRNGHPAPFPVELAVRCVAASCGDGGIALDPFMGSGTTGVACMQLGRKFIGIEIEPAYFDTACQRIENAQRQERLFA